MQCVCVYTHISKIIIKILPILPVASHLCRVRELPGFKDPVLPSCVRAPSPYSHLSPYMRPSAFSILRVGLPVPGIFPSHVARPPAQPPLPSPLNVPGPSAAACVPSSSWATISLFLDPLHAVPAGTRPGIPLVGAASITCDPKTPNLSRPAGPHALESGRPGAASGAQGSKMTEGKPPPWIRRPRLKPGPTRCFSASLWEEV